MIRKLTETLRRPEYTGENRCLPCTVLNVAIAVALGGAVSRKSKPAGVFVLAVSMAAVYLRGYLVPGTPELTKRYLPPAVLEWFGKAPGPELATGVGVADEMDGESRTNGKSRTNEEDQTVGEENEEEASGTVADPNDERSVPDDLEAYFVDAEILEPCADKDDLCLTASFETEWLDAMEAVDESADLVSTAVDAFGFDVDPGVFELEEAETGVYVLKNESRHAGKWPSYAAFVADVAAGRLLESRLDDWSAYSPRQRGQLLNSLRMFLETCPIAGGDVRVSEDVVESCCTSSTVIAVVCEETGERLFEHQIAGDASHLMA